LILSAALSRSEAARRGGKPTGPASSHARLQWNLPGKDKRLLMSNHKTPPPVDLSGTANDWSNRILIASIAGILLLTLYPFRFNWHADGSTTTFPFLLGKGEKLLRPREAFLNILLFVPFGFGLSAKLWNQGKSRAKTFLTVLCAGAFFSYSIEFLQFYIPPRDSGWHDIFTNATGAACGFLAFALFGRQVVQCLSRCETRLEAWLTPKRLVVALLIYFGFWFALSIPLQKESRLDNWVPESYLLVGNGASGGSAGTWEGKVFHLQLWNRALPDDLAQRLTSGGGEEGAHDGLLGEYDFSGVAPFQDHMKFLPDLSWIPNAPLRTESNALLLDGRAWLASRDSVSNLVKDIQANRQFSVRVVCTPSQAEGTEGRIVSISRAGGIVNLNLRQHDTDLVFWFRNGLSANPIQPALYIPGVFVVGQTRDILFSYNGSDLSLYIDGHRNSHSYKLGPGTALVQWLGRFRLSELEGYEYVYYLLVFLPSGFIFGLATRKLNWRSLKLKIPIALGFLLPVLLLEQILVSVSSRPISSHNLALSLCLIIAGCLWANADRPSSLGKN
jgi:glycopeptide antibiotics resistance protein